MAVKHKIVQDTPDEVCVQCNQNLDSTCRALSVPHTKEEEQLRRRGNYGMECDSPRVKRVRREHYGIKYRT